MAPWYHIVPLTSFSKFIVSFLVWNWAKNVRICRKMSVSVIFDRIWMTNDYVFGKIPYIEGRHGTYGELWCYSNFDIIFFLNNICGTYTDKLHAAHNGRNARKGCGDECDVAHSFGDSFGVVQKSLMFFNEEMKIFDTGAGSDLLSENLESRTGEPHERCHLTIDGKRSGRLQTCDRLMHEYEVHADSGIDGKRISCEGRHWSVGKYERTENHGYGREIIHNRYYPMEHPTFVDVTLKYSPLVALTVSHESFHLLDQILVWMERPKKVT